MDQAVAAVTGRAGRHPDADPLLRPFLDTESEETASRLLGDLLVQHARPVVRAVVARQVRVGSGARIGRAPADAEDLSAETMARLATRIGALRDGDAPDRASAVADLRGYAAVLAFNACHDWMRRLFPQRARLRNRLRYLLRHDPRFELQPAGDGSWCCGLAGRVPRDPAVAAVPAPVAEPAPAAPAPGDLSARGLRGLVLEILVRAGGWIEFETLVDDAARACGVQDAPAVSPRVDPDRLGAPTASGDLDPAAALDRRALLARLWEEILLLPVAQRSALLLNLRDPRAGGLIELFPATGVAGLRQLADALEMPPADLAALWKDLPLDDTTLAARLGRTRQQVINLRKSARERLGRRLGGGGGMLS